MITYNYLYLLDSEKSKVYFLVWKKFVQEKNPGHTRHQNYHKKISKMNKFKANFELVKKLLSKSYSLTIFGSLSVRKWQKLDLY
jgi:hypothetical protein